MFTKLFAGSFLSLGLLLAGSGGAEEAAKDCCSLKLACCKAKSACCVADARLGCCEKGMKCCEDEKACCAAVQKCCLEGSACCAESKACCGAEESPENAAKAGCCDAAKTSRGAQVKKAA